MFLQGLVFVLFKPSHNLSSYDAATLELAISLWPAAGGPGWQARNGSEAGCTAL